MNRLQIAKRIGTDESNLRRWERDGILRPLEASHPDVYAARARMIHIGRKNGVMPREVRRAFVGGGEEEGMIGARRYYGMVTGKDFRSTGQRPAHLEEALGVHKNKAAGMSDDAARAKWKRENPELAQESRAIQVGGQRELAWAEIHSAMATGDFDQPSRVKVAKPVTAATSTARGPARGGKLDWRSGVRVFRVSDFKEIKDLDEKIRVFTFVYRGASPASLGIHLVDWVGAPVPPARIGWEFLVEMGIARGFVSAAAIHEAREG